MAIKKQDIVRKKLKAHYDMMEAEELQKSIKRAMHNKFMFNQRTGIIETQKEIEDTYYEKMILQGCFSNEESDYLTIISESALYDISISSLYNSIASGNDARYRELLDKLEETPCYIIPEDYIDMEVMISASEEAYKKKESELLEEIDQQNKRVDRLLNMNSASEKEMDALRRFLHNRENRLSAYAKVYKLALISLIVSIAIYGISYLLIDKYEVTGFTLLTFIIAQSVPLILGLVFKRMVMKSEAEENK